MSGIGDVAFLGVEVSFGVGKVAGHGCDPPIPFLTPLGIGYTFPLFGEGLGRKACSHPCVRCGAYYVLLLASQSLGLLVSNLVGGLCWLWGLLWGYGACYGAVFYHGSPG